MTKDNPFLQTRREIPSHTHTILSNTTEEVPMPDFSSQEQGGDSRVSPTQFTEALFDERLKWTLMKFDEIEENFRVVRAELSKERVTRDQLLSASEKLGQQRLHTVEEALNSLQSSTDRMFNERAILITAKFEEVEKQIETERRHLRSTLEQRDLRFNAYDKQHEADVIAYKQLAAAVSAGVDGQVAELREAIRGVSRSIENVVEQHRVAHDHEHASAKEALNEYKQNNTKTVEGIVKSIDSFKDERGRYVQRDAHDTANANLLAQIDRVERQGRDALTAFNTQATNLIDSKVKTIDDTYNVRVQQISDRLVQIDRGISVSNARNQQSIIALGILLTLVEIIVRYVSKGP